VSLSFGDFELDQERRQLLRSGRPVALEPKAYELLSLLVERRPRVLSHKRTDLWLLQGFNARQGLLNWLR
jgi:DNA-binding winged helix-turn-helix (wHTH) protein